MNNLFFIKENQVVTDSLTVAEVFGKDHKNLLEEIYKQIEYVGEGFARLNFQPGYYTDKYNQERRKFNLIEEVYTLIVFGYRTKEAVHTKIKFIQEFKKMVKSIHNQLH